MRNVRARKIDSKWQPFQTDFFCFSNRSKYIKTQHLLTNLSAKARLTASGLTVLEGYILTRDWVYLRKDWFGLSLWVYIIWFPWIGVYFNNTGRLVLKTKCYSAWLSMLNMGLINKGWYGMFVGCGIWCSADVSSDSPSSKHVQPSFAVCSDEEGPTLDTSAKHHIPQATNIPYQPLLIKPILQ